eukprot:2558858-Alexandrium_andersonii.AAC.1
MPCAVLQLLSLCIPGDALWPSEVPCGTLGMFPGTECWQWQSAAFIAAPRAIQQSSMLSRRLS